MSLRQVEGGWAFPAECKGQERLVSEPPPPSRGCVCLGFLHSQRACYLPCPAFGNTFNKHVRIARRGEDSRYITEGTWRPGGVCLLPWALLLAFRGLVPPLPSASPAPPAPLSFSFSSLLSFSPSLLLCFLLHIHLLFKWVRGRAGEKTLQLSVAHDRLSLEQSHLALWVPLCDKCLPCGGPASQASWSWCSP